LAQAILGQASQPASRSRARNSRLHAAMASRKRPIFNGAPAPSSSRPRVGVDPPMNGVFMPAAFQGLPPAPAYFPQPNVPPARFVGKVISYDHGKGFGFIHCGAIPEGDVFLQKKELPSHAKDSANLSLKGKSIEFEVFLTPDGKPRATRISILDDRGTGRDRDRERRRDRDRGDDGAPPPLDARTVEAMTRFLEDRGGAMDFGKFAREFKAVKKIQLEEHFTLVAEDGDKGGRWQIMLPGSEPMPVEEEEPRENEVAVVERPPPHEPRNDTPMGHFEGVIQSYDGIKGYGFIKSEEVIEGDVYFRKSALPPDARSMPRSELVGARVEFDGMLTPDGKPRAESIAVVEFSGGDAELEVVTPVAAEKPEYPALPEEQIQEMRAFLEEQGGAMDYGRFANQFPGVKKAQLLPLESDFTLIQLDSNAGGRWKITLPGVDPQDLEESDEVRPKASSGAVPGGGMAKLAPSEHFWLIGCIKKWDAKRHFGFLVADGADDVFVHKNDLPDEMKNMRHMMGVEMAFELEISDEGKLKAKTIRPLIRPDGRGGWQFRRA